jgi:hypothetical protein
MFMMPFGGILPFVHESSLHKRLLYSMFATALVSATLLTIAPRRVRKAAMPTGTLRNRLRDVFGIAVGLCLFTYCAAEFSPNLFGLAASVLPGDVSSRRVVIHDAEYRGSRLRAVTLTYKDPVDGAFRYLVLSKRLFGYPKLGRGDPVNLHVKHTLVGGYVTQAEFEASRANPSIERTTTGKPVVAAHVER